MHESAHQKSALKPSRRGLIKGAAGVALAGALPAGLIAQPDGRPNVLFILADDLGYADLSCYGRRDYRTPALDRLAAQGMRLTQGYSNSAVCSPTRVALLTGRYHQRLPVGLPEPITTEWGSGSRPGTRHCPACCAQPDTARRWLASGTWGGRRSMDP